MKASDFKISTRIGAGFFALVLFTLAVGAMSILQLSRLAGNTQTLAQTNIPGLELTARLRDHLNEIRRSEARHLLSSARKEMKVLAPIQI